MLNMYLETQEVSLWQQLLLLVEELNSTQRKDLTSSSMLRAATELSSLKSINDNASVRRKLPSAEEDIENNM